MIDFCHIMPTAFLNTYANKYKTQLILAHLVEEDEHYRNFFAKYNRTKIMDNSAFEMFKTGQPMYPADKLIEMGHKVNADYIVMSDYPNEDPSKTIAAAEELAPKFKEAEFGTFFCPQSKIGDFYVFPYDMRHCVYPFNGPGMRRTLAANMDVHYDPVKNRGAH